MRALISDPSVSEPGVSNIVDHRPGSENHVVRHGKTSSRQRTPVITRISSESAAWGGGVFEDYLYHFA